MGQVSRLGGDKPKSRTDLVTLNWSANFMIRRSGVTYALTSLEMNLGRSKQVSHEVLLTSGVFLAKGDA